MSAPEIGRYDAGYAEHFVSSFDPHLNLTIIHTTPEGTLAALKAASDSAGGLYARIRLVVPHAVPFRLPLEAPMISTQFLKAREDRLVAQSGLDENSVSIEICLCRQPKIALRDYLPAGSLLMIGGKQGWWRNEQRLAKWLAAVGHQVLFVDVKPTKQRISETVPLATPARSRKFASLRPR